MRNFDVVVKTPRGHLTYTVEVGDTIPAGLVLEGALTHPQVSDALKRLDMSLATTIAVHTPSQLQIPPGFTVVMPDGVNFNGPMVNDIPAHYSESKRRTIDRVFRNQAALVQFIVDPEH